MRFGPPAMPRQPRENVVPMINVVFLLLIFFMLAAQLAPPEPFSVAPPEGEVAEALPEGAALFVSASGDLALGELRGEAVFAALHARDEAGPLPVRADAGLSAEALAALLPRLAAAGVSSVALELTPDAGTGR